MYIASCSVQIVDMLLLCVVILDNLAVACTGVVECRDGWASHVRMGD